MPESDQKEFIRDFRESLSASDISSDIAPAQAANGGKQKQLEEGAPSRKLALAERLRDRKQTVARRGKEISANPCLPAILQIVATSRFRSPAFAVVCHL